MISAWFSDLSFLLLGFSGPSFCGSIVCVKAKCTEDSLVKHSGLKRCLTNVISHGFNGEAHISESLRSKGF